MIGVAILTTVKLNGKNIDCRDMYTRGLLHGQGSHLVAGGFFGVGPSSK